MQNTACWGIILLLLAGCNIMSPNTAYEQKLKQWKGKTAEQLYDAFGAPNQTTPIDDDTIMVTYNEVANSPLDGDFEPYDDEMNYQAMSVPSYGIMATSPLYYCQTSFILRNDIIVGYNFNGDDCL